jgi:hypothetical protein
MDRVLLLLKLTYKLYRLLIIGSICYVVTARVFNLPLQVETISVTSSLFISSCFWCMITLCLLLLNLKIYAVSCIFKCLL